MDALHSARKNFIQAESSEKIKRVIRHQVKTYADKIYENGEKVKRVKTVVKGKTVPVGKDMM